MGKSVFIFSNTGTMLLGSCLFWLTLVSYQETGNSSHYAHLTGFIHLVDQKFSSLKVNGSGLLDTVQVAESINLNGSFILKKVQCAQFKGNGTIEVENFSVTDHAILNGPCTLHQAAFNEVVINGFCRGHNIKVAKTMKIHGSSDFFYLTCSVLCVTSKATTLTHSVIDTIIIKGGHDTYRGVFNLWGLLSWTNNNEEQEAVLILDATTVRASVVFEDVVPGKVILKNGSRVAGSVVGGTIEWQ